MLIFLWVLEVIVVILLILAVLMQVGRGETLGSMFGGGAQSIFGPKGPVTLLEKITMGLIAAFFLITIAITKFSSPPRTITPQQTLPEVPSPEEALPQGIQEENQMPENITR